MDLEVMQSYLTGDYADTFSRVKAYAAFKNISSDEINERLEELYDILYTAQKQNKDVRKITGNDLEKFCKEFFGDYTIFDRIKKLPYSVYKAMWVIFVFSFITILADDHPIRNLFTITDDMAGILIGAAIILVIDFVCMVLIAPQILRLKKIKSDTWSFIMLVVMILVFIAVFWLMGDIKLEVKAFYTSLVSLIYIAVYSAITLSMRYKRYGTIKNVQKAIRRERKENAPVDLNLKKSFLEGSLTRYKRLEKKGKVTPFTYADTLKKDKKMYENGEKIYYITGLICGGFVVIETAITETILDALCFGLILTIILYFIIGFFKRFDRSMLKIVCAVIDEYTSSELGFPEYVQSVFDGKIGADFEGSEDI